MKLQDFHHRFEPGLDPAATPLLLLHGTGGNEHDLITFGRAIAPRAPLLGVRGRVLEGPVNRWFRRFGEGRFDLEDMERRAGELAGFVAEAGRSFGFATAPIAVGYSNGANIAGALLMRHPDVLSGAVLMRAMNGLGPAPGLNLAAKRVLLLSGAHDPYGPADSRAILTANLRAAGADVSEEIAAPGHGLVQRDLTAAASWLSA
jgi:phospholipase/carboxylesterase